MDAKSLPGKIDRKPFFSARHGVALLFLACLLGIAYAIYAYLTPGTLEETISKQFSAIHSNQFTKAYYDYTSRDFQKSTSLDAFRNYLNTFPPFGKNKKIDFSRREIEGDTALIEAEFTAENGETLDAEFRMIKEEGKWKILSMRRLQKKAVEQDDATATEALIRPVARQLEALQASDVERAFKDGASKAFQEKTSLDEFRTFIKAYPILTHFKTFDYKQHAMEGTAGEVVVVLDPDGEAVPVEFRLIKEEGQWKVLSFRLVLPELEGVDSPALTGVVREMLLSLQKGDIQVVYDKQLSREFRKKMNLEQFTQFIKDNPILFYNYPFLVKLTPKENRVTFLGTLTSKHGKVYLMECDLVKENEVWKILDIRILPDGA